MSDLISRQAAIDAFDGVKVDEENCTEYDIGYNDGIDFTVSKLSALPSADVPEVVYCKDCRKHNHAHGYYHDGTFIGIMDCCPLIEIRGKAQGHEFDYQYCVYGKRKDTC